jgi:hypothetical protein
MATFEDETSAEKSVETERRGRRFPGGLVMLAGVAALTALIVYKMYHLRKSIKKDEEQLVPDGSIMTPDHQPPEQAEKPVRDWDMLKSGDLILSRLPMGNEKSADGTPIPVEPLGKSKSAMSLIGMRVIQFGSGLGRTKVGSFWVHVAVLHRDPKTNELVVIDVSRTGLTIHSLPHYVAKFHEKVQFGIVTLRSPLKNPDMWNLAVENIKTYCHGYDFGVALNVIDRGQEMLERSSPAVSNLLKTYSVNEKIRSRMVPAWEEVDDSRPSSSLSDLQASWKQVRIHRASRTAGEAVPTGGEEKAELKPKKRTFYTCMGRHTCVSSVLALYADSNEIDLEPRGDVPAANQEGDASVPFPITKNYISAIFPNEMFVPNALRWTRSYQEFGSLRILQTESASSSALF